MTPAPPDRLHAGDVLRLWNEEQARLGRKPIKLRTVYATIASCQPAAPGKPPNRYQDRPIPMPEYPHPDRPRAGQTPFWRPAAGESLAELEQRLREWWASRPGRGRPGVRQAFRTRQRRCGCGSGVFVDAGSPCGQCGYGLTARERAVCTEAVCGFTIPEMATRLGVTQATIHAQLRSAYRRLGVHSRDELIERMAREPRRRAATPAEAATGTGR